MSADARSQLFALFASPSHLPAATHDVVTIGGPVRWHQPGRPSFRNPTRNKCSEVRSIRASIGLLLAIVPGAGAASMWMMHRAGQMVGRIMHAIALDPAAGPTVRGFRGGGTPGNSGGQLAPSRSGQLRRAASSGCCIVQSLS